MEIRLKPLLARFFCFNFTIVSKTMRRLYAAIILVTACLGSSFIALKQDITVNEEASSAKVLRFYPNPATTIISFEFDKSIDKSYTLQLYNFIGKRMTEVKITDSKITVNLDDSYLRGLYIYQLRDITGKIIESGKFQVSK